jgi:DNA (cytosine-5)-methyltransferase 1
MEMAGHKCVGHVEIDKFANKSYQAMHNPKEGEYFADDIRNVEPGDLPEADCWCGGFPCQAFSVAGKRRGFEDMRGTLIFEVFRLAAERKPKILFLENVAGLLNHDGGRTFAAILAGLWELGYDVQWQSLNSKNFGVPQNRERVFIVGHLGKGSARKVFPIGHGNKTAVRNERQGVYTNTLTTRITADSVGTYVVEDKQHAQNKIKQNIEARAVLTPDREEKQQNGRRIKEDGEPMFTLTAQDRHGVMINQKIEVIKNGYAKESNTRKILRELREEIGEESFTKWGLRILNPFQQEIILQPKLHGNTLVKDRQVSRGTIGEMCESDCQKNNGIYSKDKYLSNMWQEKKVRYTPQGWELSKQLIKQFDNALQKLPYEITLCEKCLQDLWEASEGIWVLRKTLSEIQKIWQSAFGKGWREIGTQGLGGDDYKQGDSIMRIRRLTPL